MKQSVKLIAGNWKMNGLSADLAVVQDLKTALQKEPAACRVALCPPATLISRLAEAARGHPIEVGGQDCRAETHGAYTGGVSAGMLKDAGATLVIVGHSERRQEFGETDLLISAKAEAAVTAGLAPIVCVGETLEQREAGRAVEIVRSQVMNSLPQAVLSVDFAVAYEPVWAIGTGDAASGDDAQAVGAFIRDILRDLEPAAADDVPIQYGGSVTDANAAEFFSEPDIDGALVGGASLKPDAFAAILRAAADAASSA